MTPADLQRVAEAMRSPDFYSQRPTAVDVVETHASWVFLVDDRAYKLRKQVVYPFLDYGTSARRRAFCVEEVRLGRRLAPDLYIGLRSVVDRDGKLELADADADGAIEHVTEMRRFDERCTLAATLAVGRVSQDDVRRLARHVAAFHAAAAPAPVGAFDATAVAATIDENFVTLLDRADVVGASRLAAAHRFAVAFVHGRREMIDRRAADGHVRDGHGDLRLEHVLLGEQIEVFDPLEFDPRLRQIDILADVAFLVMELAAAGRADLADLLAAEYQAAANEPDTHQLLWFYAAYRAWVRAKVRCLRGEQLEAPDRDVELEQARRLAELGSRLVWRTRQPLLLVICGGSATGKTHLASALAEVSGLAHISSDVVRKDLAGIEPHQRAPDREYSEQASLLTYRELGARAAAAPGGAIVDATFRRRDDRAAFAAAYGDRDPRPLLVECRAPAATIAERARRRTTDRDRASDATPALAAQMIHEFDPLDEVPPSAHLALRTDRPVEIAIADIEASLDARIGPPWGPTSTRRRTTDV